MTAANTGAPLLTTAVAVACVWATPTIHRDWVRVAITALSLLVASSTVFVKQHAILDLFTGAALGAVAVLVSFAVFRRSGKGKPAA